MCRASMLFTTAIGKWATSIPHQQNWNISIISKCKIHNCDKMHDCRLKWWVKQAFQITSYYTPSEQKLSVPDLMNMRTYFCLLRNMTIVVLWEMSPSHHMCWQEKLNAQARNTQLLGHCMCCWLAWIPVLEWIVLYRKHGIHNKVCLENTGRFTMRMWLKLTTNSLIITMFNGHTKAAIQETLNQLG